MSAVRFYWKESKVYFRGMKETAGLLLEQRITDIKELRPHLEGF